MKTGVISDTHGRLDRTRAALAVFDLEAVEMVLHCGDVGDLAILELFVGRPFRFVWGNTDRPDASWRRALQTWEMEWPDSRPLQFELAGKRIILAHGHERTFPQVADECDADFLFFGHSHTPALVRTGGCTVVNPGAIHRTPQPTVAIVETDTGEVRHLDLAGREVAVR